MGQTNGLDGRGSRLRHRNLKQLLGCGRDPRRIEPQLCPQGLGITVLDERSVFFLVPPEVSGGQ